MGTRDLLLDDGVESPSTGTCREGSTSDLLHGPSSGRLRVLVYGTRTLTPGVGVPFRPRSHNGDENQATSPGGGPEVGSGRTRSRRAVTILPIAVVPPVPRTVSNTGLFGFRLVSAGLPWTGGLWSYTDPPCPTLTPDTPSPDLSPGSVLLFESQSSVPVVSVDVQTRGLGSGGTGSGTSPSRRTSVSLSRVRGLKPPRPDGSGRCLTPSCWGPSTQPRGNTWDESESVRGMG